MRSLDVAVSWEVDSAAARCVEADQVASPATALSVCTDKIASSRRTALNWTGRQVEVSNLWEFSPSLMGFLWEWECINHSHWNENDLSAVGKNGILLLSVKF